MYYKELAIIYGRIRRNIEQGTPRHLLRRVESIVPEWGRSYKSVFGRKYFYFPATKNEYEAAHRKQGRGDLLRAIGINNGFHVGTINDAGQLVRGFSLAWCPNRHQRKHNWQAIVQRLEKDAGLC